MSFIRNDSNFCQKLESWKDDVPESERLAKTTDKERKTITKNLYRSFLERYISDYIVLFDTEDYTIKRVNSIPEELRQDLKKQYKELLLTFDSSNILTWMKMDRIEFVFRCIDEARADALLYVDKKKKTIEFYPSDGKNSIIKTGDSKEAEAEAIR